MLFFVVVLRYFRMEEDLSIWEVRLEWVFGLEDFERVMLIFLDFLY